jgi:hypothetical protein
MPGAAAQFLAERKPQAAETWSLVSFWGLDSGNTKGVQAHSLMVASSSGNLGITSENGNNPNEGCGEEARW